MSLSGAGHLTPDDTKHRAFGAEMDPYLELPTDQTSRNPASSSGFSATC